MTPGERCLPGGPSALLPGVFAATDTAAKAAVETDLDSHNGGDGAGNTKKPAARVRLLDGLRGFSVFSMVGYHAMYDLVYVFGAFGTGMAWYRGLPGYLWQQSICWVFILVSGASLHYGRRAFRRGALVLGCAMVLSLVTCLATPQLAIRFGVLHMLGCAMLLGALLRPVLSRVPPVAGLVVSFLLFALFKTLPGGYLGFLDARLWTLPGELYGTAFLFPVGLPGPGFASSDYFPLFPWAFLYFAGYFAWALFKKRAVAAAPGKNPLEWAGRHSLWVYMAHQPVIYGVCLLLQVAGAFG